MKLGWVIYYVQDVATTLVFYEKAFGLSRTMLSEGGEFGTLDTGGTALAFCSEAFLEAEGDMVFDLMRPDRPLLPFEVAFTTGDVEAAYRKAIAAGATPLIPPRTKPWGQVVSYVRDLNGFQVEICSLVE